MDALLDTTCSEGSVTRAIDVTVKRSLAQGPGMVGDLSQLVNVLKMNPATELLIQEGSRCFATTCPSCKKLWGPHCQDCCKMDMVLAGG